jgi:polar amino acid transport system substrate-binding protein
MNSSQPTRRLFTLVASAAILACAMSSASGAADLLQEVKDRGFMRVGVWSEPPESWIETESGEWKGIDADIFKLIAKEIGVEIDPIVLVHSSLGPALQSGRLDAIAGLYKTEERQKVMSYTNLPLWYSPDILVVSADNTNIKTLEDLKGKVIGTVRGSATETEANKLAEQYGASEVRKFANFDPLLMDIEAGRVDAGVWVGAGYRWRTSKPGGPKVKLVETLPPELLGAKTFPGNFVTFRKTGSDAMIAAVDKALRKIVESGQIKAILEKYGFTDDTFITGTVGK